ncbi:MAG: 50S ribosomal protein L4 [Gemmatimonadetes bacterium]|nr:50S ribosomal protein L4 [Gemmatimonadota bacterium]
MKATCYDINGSDQGEHTLPDWLFDGVVNDAVMHQAVKVYLLNQRRGTGAAKSRGMVAGGGRKPWRQKGTGRARAGTIRSGIWTGGGVIFPPVPHSWRQRIPKRVRALARRSALNSRAQGNRISLVERLDFDDPKTKKLKEILANIGLDGKVLLLTDGQKETVYLSGRNLQEVIVRPFGQESVYDILWCNVVLIEQEALEASGPSESDRKANVSRSRGRPEVKVREESQKAKSEAVRKARKGHGVAKVESSVGSPGPRNLKFDIASIKLPKISELSEFLLEFDSVDDVGSLSQRDGRKTAKAIYEARLAALGNDSVEENG